jgi:Ca2+-binding RTX toxin-like protein
VVGFSPFSIEFSFDSPRLTLLSFDDDAAEIPFLTTVLGNGGNSSDTVTLGQLVTISAVLGGGLGRDSLTGGAMADTLAGDEGADVLNSMGGGDLLQGGHRV